MSIFRRLCNFSATLFGVGHIPVMPGTFGTVVAITVYLSIPEEWFTLITNLTYTLPVLLAFGILGAYLSGQAEKLYGKDASVIVIDEFVGYFFAVVLLPRTVWTLIYSFVLFRSFDIAKPFPINRLQKIPGGWGVMADDILAGIYANVLLHILLKINPGFFGIS